MNRDKVGLIQARTTSNGPLNRRRDIMELQIEKDPGISQVSYGFYHRRPFSNEKLQTDLENTHVLTEQTNVLASLLSTGHI